jgi:hypothetical protein
MVLQVVHGAPYLASVWFVDEWPLASPNSAVMVVVMAPTPQLTQGRAMVFGSPLGGVCGGAQQILPAVGQ